MTTEPKSEGFPIPLYALIATLAVFGVVAAYVTVDASRKAKQAADLWKPLPGAPVKYFGPVAPELLWEAYTDAVRLADEVPAWSDKPHFDLLAGYKIRVMPEQSWKNYAGISVDSESNPDLKLITVNRTLSGLFHEVAHVYEDRLLGAIDYGHQHWEARGIWAKDAEFKAKWPTGAR